MTTVGRSALGVVAGGVLTSACALPPQGVTRDQIGHYEKAVASIGCELVYDSDYLPVELQADLTRAQVVEITQYQLAAGKAERLANGGVKLTTGACA
ncbi:MAG: hypothetical protein RI571_07700 [Roseovarius sp.]|nr:hypothetical protein [Roseovarius sp.]